jgi:L-alanine-DL-glutamate epimerase-like enolase superfamily enzyme
MESVYHDSFPVAMPCSRNMAGARQQREDGEVLVKLNDTSRIAGYGVIPISEYAARYVWRKSRLR